MHTPLIRFSGETLNHPQVDGQNQEWAHMQFDSHGLFLLVLADAIESGLITSDDLTLIHMELFALFPAFFTQKNYAQLEDYGPWEERGLINASSAGLVVSGQKRIMDVISRDPDITMQLLTQLEVMDYKYSPEFMEIVRRSIADLNILQLYQDGMRRVETNLRLGGEAPGNYGRRFHRGADAALLFLGLLDHSPYANDPDRISEILKIVQSLVGPHGVYRYKYDAYQAANFWISETPLQQPLTGPQTEISKEVARFTDYDYQPGLQQQDAQWFFDSNIAELYYRLSQLVEAKEEQLYFLERGDLHLKRALGQITGHNTYAANGEKLDPWLLPESINMVKGEPKPSPVCPLSWSVAALIMALDRAEKVHVTYETQSASMGECLINIGRV